MSKVAYVFPGQGSQYAGMGLDLYQNVPAAKAVFDEADRVLGFPLSKLCFEGPNEELKKTINAQPALLTMSIACLEAASGYLPEPSFMAGHSLGEYTALTAAGSLDFSTAVRLARERGRLMQEAGAEQPGGMAAIIGMSMDLLEAVCAETGAFIANLNCPGQIVISGTADKVRDAMKLARQRGAKLAIPLQVSGAFHSPLMRTAADGLKERLQNVPLMSRAMEASEALRKSFPKVTVNVEYPQPDHVGKIQDAIGQTFLRAPLIPVIGNVHVQVLDSAESVRTELQEQVCSCVRWEETIHYMLDQGVDTFIEIGPGEVLTGLLKRIAPEAKHINIGKLSDPEALG